MTNLLKYGPNQRWTKHGLIGKIQPNGEVELGDACQREYMYLFGLSKWNKKLIKLSLDYELRRTNRLLVDGWNFRRSNDLDWTGEWNRGSRDQAIPMICAWGSLKQKKLLWTFLLGLILRLGFMTNTKRNGSTKENHGQYYKTKNGKKYYRNYNWKLPDFAGPSFWAALFRGLSLWPLYPVICLLDIELVINAYLWRYQRKSPDINNHMILSINALDKIPTPLSWWANKINSYELTLSKIKEYFDPTEFQPMVNIYEPIIRRVMS